MTSHPPSVVCLVLNWNNWPDTHVCLDAVANVEYPNLTVIALDNGSTDNSVQQIRATHPGIELIENGANLGFGAGNNVGLRVALERQFDYVWLLNNDTIPRADALRELVAKAEASGRLGAVGSVLEYVDDPNTVQAWGGGRVNPWLGRVSHATSPKADEWFHYITAASVLIRREALQDIGLFDEGFFLYWEDTDLGVRLRQSGWQLGVAARSVVLHKEGGSTRGNFKVHDRYSTTSGIRFLRKHAPIPLFSIFLFLTARILRRVMSGEMSRVGAVVRGIKDYANAARKAI